MMKVMTIVKMVVIMMTLKMMITMEKVIILCDNETTQYKTGLKYWKFIIDITHSPAVLVTPHYWPHRMLFP